LLGIFDKFQADNIGKKVFWSQVQNPSFTQWSSKNEETNFSFEYPNSRWQEHFSLSNLS
jgi:hypothetical protein